MFNFKAFIAFISVASLCYCTPQPQEEPVAMESLEGSWRMISYRDQTDTAWKSHPDTRIYEKHISPTHFCWISYETDQDTLLGSGGGTYIYDKESGTYTEDIKFFLPAGSQLLGQSIPFKVHFEDGKWYHTGFSKVFEFDPETGENVVTDSTKIEEIWERIDDHPEQDGLVGTWQLESYKGEGDSIRSDYPDFVSYVKLLTPTHFLWVHYLGEQDQVLAEGGGTYVYNGDTYTETLNFVYPSGSGQVGTVLPFSCRVEGDTWYHKGHIIIHGQDEESGEATVDSVLIDEVWKPFSMIN